MTKKRYLKIFQTTEEYNSTKDEVLDYPYVALLEDKDDVVFGEEEDYSKEYFTIEVLEDGEMGFCIGTGSEAVDSLWYSVDEGENWNELERDAMISVSQGQKVLWKQDYATLNGYNNKVGSFKTTMPFNAYGNIMSLIYGDNFANKTSLEGYNSIFLGLFFTCTILQSAENLILPATTLVDGCYSYMFNGCTSLTTALELSATKLADSCYNGMFSNCTSLTKAPSILPATTLARGCYSSMFANCTSLTEAPELLATTLVDYCYSYMFNGCSKLIYIKMLATDINASNCLNYWVSGVAEHGTFVKNKDATWDVTGASGIPEDWTVENG